MGHCRKELQLTADSLAIFSVSPSNLFFFKELQQYVSGDQQRAIVPMPGCQDRMEETRRRPLPIRFGAFELNLHAGELHKQGAKIKLQEQPFLVLAMLVEHPGDVVTREELQKQLWPSDTFVDFERGLNRAINKLREALVDDADNPRFIETLPRRGYRFIAPVDSAEPVKHPLALVKPEVPPEAPVRFAKGADKLPKGRWFAAMLVLLSISAIFFLRQRPAVKTQLLRLQLSPPVERKFCRRRKCLDRRHGAFARWPDIGVRSFGRRCERVMGAAIKRCRAEVAGRRASTESFLVAGRKVHWFLPGYFLATHRYWRRRAGDRLLPPFRGRLVWRVV
jgi:DNA-binding winged helix-turn-helix (wHTH) protein